MSNDQNPGSWAGRFFGWCLLVLGGAIALNGAVEILGSIWVSLSVLLAVVAGGWIVWASRRRY